ncbi:MAG TPA: DegT/DnrJ/EryC1/StrS aminotransferase family protein [Acidiferrobacteraceae bacterium]|nr:DegT/DnrJ/EryC1/StrS aminotransferase family protein [Acidiferrobacteraceae bacterium]
MSSSSSGGDFLPFAKPSIGDAEIAEVTACLRSGWITTGPRVQQFEQALRDYFGGTREVLALANATAGLHLALLALDLKPGDEVITTPLTFAATLNMIVAAGGRPVLVDIIPGTYNLDPDALAHARTRRTRAILPVHFAGRPADLAPIYAFAARHGLRVIEDAAQAIGAEYGGQRLGSFGDVQVFSFHPNKNMTTGEGGCVVTADPKLARAISVMRFHGIDREAWNRYARAGSALYDVVAPGFKYNMMDLQAALGLHQLPRLDGFNRRRAELAARYWELLCRCPGLTLPLPAEAGQRHVWNLYTPLVEPQAVLGRDEFVEQMKARNIGVGLHYQAIHLHSYYRKQYGFRPGDFPEAEKVSAGTVTLPLFPDMTTADQDRVVAAVQELMTCR